MAFTIKKDNEIMNKLGVTELRHYIAQTNKGELTLMLRKGETQYRFVLDAVPVSEEINEELMDLLYPPKTVETSQVKKDFDPVLELAKSHPIAKIKSKGRPKKK